MVLFGARCWSRRASLAVAGMRRCGIAAIGVVAVVVILAVAGAQPAGAVRDGTPAMETVGLAGVVNSDRGPEAKRQGRPPKDPSGGFIYRDGRYKSLDTLDGLITGHVAINNRGQTAGAYFRTELDPGGFVRSRRGGYPRFEVAPGPSTLPVDINDRGTTVGLSGDAVTGQARAFRRSPNGDV